MGVKDRIIEYLAVKKLNPDAASPILCFRRPARGRQDQPRSFDCQSYGQESSPVSPSVVCETKPIFAAIARPTSVRIQAALCTVLKSAASSNPIIMLDEIDKIGVDQRGDPAAALLEALDAEQNSTFVDHYLGVEFDLSRVLFIANANTMSTVPFALRDRLEVIDISGYSEAEKISIANQFLVPKQLSEAGLNSQGLRVSFSRAATQQGYQQLYS